MTQEQLIRSMNIALFHLQDYLGEFPEHDQGDLRVALAAERLEVLILDLKKEKES